MSFERALEIGRPPNIRKLFPNSKALIVSGKVIDRAMMKKGNAMTIAANGRNMGVIRGSLRAAQKANAALIVEIAKSESNYCMSNFWNLARRVDQVMNELGITIPVAIHADHYGLKTWDEVEPAKVEIPTLFEAGITSIAIDASHMLDDDNLKANLELAPLIPGWAGYETEIGEIKGKDGMSTAVEAEYLVQGLNAHNIIPDWIALNNGTTHGIEASSEGIQVGLTAEIHEAITKYGVSGAQHGTSGNHNDRLREICVKTNTTKANVATALQMVSWGVKVNEFGNAILDADGNFDKVAGNGVSSALWADMVAYADKNGIKGGNFKKLNLPFENRMMAEPLEIRERIEQGVEDFMVNLLKNVMNAGDTAPLAYEAIIAAGSHDLGPKADRIGNPDDWTEEKYRARVVTRDRGPEGDFED